MANWEGLLALSHTQVWGDYSDQVQRKIAADGIRFRVPGRIEQYGRVTDSRELHRSVALGFDYDFEWVQWVSYRNIVEVLFFALGSEAVTGSDPYTHTYSTAAALPHFNTYIDQNIGNSPALNICGCKVSALVLENNSADILRATVRGIGRSHRRISALSVSATDDEQFALHPFIFSHLAFNQGLNGATRAIDRDIERLRISYENILRPRTPSSASQYIIEPREGIARVSGSFQMEMEDWDEFDVFIAGQQMDISAVWTYDAYSLTLTIAQARITEHPLPAAGGNDRSVVEIRFVGLNDGSNTVSVVLVTDQTAVVYESSSSSSQSSSSSSSSSSSESSSSSCSSASSQSSSSSSSSQSSSSSTSQSSWSISSSSSSESSTSSQASSGSS